LQIEQLIVAAFKDWYCTSTSYEPELELSTVLLELSLFSSPAHWLCGKWKRRTWCVSWVQETIG